MSIDYGMGRANIDKATGIRYGVISQNEILQAWCDEAEADYGKPTCPNCGSDTVDASKVDEEDGTDEAEWTHTKYGCDDHACRHCRSYFDSSEVYGDEALGFTYEAHGYEASQGSDGDIFVTKSPYCTYAAFCSPCAPGAVYLMDSRKPETESGAMGYCFGHDWFEDGKAPYPVYRVDTMEIVNPE